MKTKTLLLVIIGMLVVGIFLSTGQGFPAKLPNLMNFESGEYANTSGFMQPESVIDGLAVYSVGSGEPILLFPYPHAHTIEPMAQGPIADALVAMGKRVITFDVPGAYHSTREPVGDISEMIASAEEALDYLEIKGPVDVVGHSMSGLAALGFVIERPERAKSLVMIGSMSGFPAVLKNGMPGSAWKIWEKEYWQFIWLGLRVKSGFANLAAHKELYNVMSRESFHNQDLFAPLPIHPDDRDQGIPIREIVWGKNMTGELNYADQLASVQVPTFIIVGRYDPQAPLPCSEELHEQIPNSEMVIFEHSGHNPYLEEPAYFSETIENFFNVSLMK